jgi:hypothetical protein
MGYTIFNKLNPQGVEVFMVRALRRTLAAVLCAGLSASPLYAQSSSGTITGRVLDTTGQAIPQATVTLVRADTNEVRSLVTTSSGEIVFASVLPGPYTLRVEAQGFKTLEKTNLTLSASERIGLGKLTLEIGAVTESVTVEATKALVQTTSSERGALIDANQVTQLPTRGRDIFGLMPTLPGVVYDGRGNDGIGSSTVPAGFSGVRGQYSMASIDGISGNTRSGNQLDTTIAMDAVAEVKVLMNNYQAEYGKAAAGIINIVTKSGSKEFHGSSYYYNRNENLNANSFFNNKAGTERGRYRFNTVGGTLGGPLYIPGLMNDTKDKLFFFGALEFRPSTTPNSTRYYTVPTAEQRNGDFRRSVGDSRGTLYSVDRIIDPLTGRPFPGGIIPANRIDPNIQKLLNIFPLPNAPDELNGGALNPSGQWYNFSIAGEQERPAWQNSLRLDYNVSDGVHAYARYTNYANHNKGLTSAVNRLQWMEGADIDYQLKGHNWGGTVNWIANPTLLADFTLGYASWLELQTYPDDLLPRLQRDQIGFDLPQLFPGQNPLNVVPAIEFGGTNIGPNAATILWEGRFPMNTIADSWTASANLTKIRGPHQLKGGVAFERVRYAFRNSGTSNIWSGRFNFAHNTSNPSNATSYPYASALLGTFNTYTESTSRTPTSPVTPILEFYAQDTWKASSRLTLDIGFRFTAGIPQHQATEVGGGRFAASSFVPDRYDPAQAPILYRPALNGTTRAAVDPRNPSVFLPSAYIGQVVPGTGNLENGVVVSGDPGYPRDLVDFQGIGVAPRLGFAWDVLGDGSTAIRGGFGLNFNPRNGGGLLGDQKTNPPIVYEPTVNFGTTATYRDSQGTFTPPDFSRVFNRKNPKARVANTSLGIQRRLPLNMVIDVAYVGTFGRHIGAQTGLNSLPYGKRFEASSLDPSFSRPQALHDDFLRPYRGYAAIPYLSFDTNSNYHALQSQLQRKFSNNFQLGLVYTWSKAMDYADGENGTVVTFNDRREWNYGLASYDRTHVFAANYLWSLPGGGLKSGVLRSIVGGWQLSGITRIQSGEPFSFNSPSLRTGCTAGVTPCVATTANNFGTDITGGGDGWRVVQTGDPNLPRGERTPDRWFDTTVFAPPALAQTVTDMAGVQRVLAAGNVGRRFIRGPSMFNTDLALFKNFRLKGNTTAQFRAEAYNVFNHTQFLFTDANRQPIWDQSGVQTNPSFGKVSNARDPRIIQLGFQMKF